MLPDREPMRAASAWRTLLSCMKNSLIFLCAQGGKDINLEL